MKLAISNFAWEPELNEEVFSEMQNFWYSGLELAPKKIFKNIRITSDKEILQFKEQVQSKGISIIALQGILFWEPNLEIFGSTKSRDDLVEYMQRIGDIAVLLWTKAIVFGAPKNRNIYTRTEKEVAMIWDAFFKEVGDRYEAMGINLCIEANSIDYGCNYITSTFEAAELVRRVNSPGFKLHIDTWVLISEEEDFESIMSSNEGKICHFHASEPGLIPLLNPNLHQHTKYASVLQSHGYKEFVSIEMVLKWEEDVLETIRKSLYNVAEIYR